MITLPFITKRELKDIKALSIVIFIGVFLALTAIVFHFINKNKGFDQTDAVQLDNSKLFYMDENLNSVKALSILLISFTF